MLQTQFYVSRTGHILGHILYHCCTLHTALYHFAHYILSILGYVGLHDCNLYVKTGTNRALHNIYIGCSVIFRIFLSLSGCVHYVACMGEQVHAAKLISNTYYITYDYMIACM